MTEGASSASPAAIDANSGDELLRRPVLQQEPARAGTERLVARSRPGRTSSGSGRARRLARARKPARRLDPVHRRHPDVHHDDVRREPSRTAGSRRRRRSPRPRPRCRPARPGSSGTGHASAPGRRRSARGSRASLTPAPTGRRAPTRNPPPGRGPCLDLAAEQLTALAHPDQPVPAGGLGILRRSGAVVGDLGARARPARSAPRRARSPCRACRSEFVERLLTMRLGGQVDAGRQRSRRPLDDRLDRQARGAHRVEQLRRGGRSPGCGARPRAVVPSALRTVKQAAHLGAGRCGRTPRCWRSALGRRCRVPGARTARAAPACTTITLMWCATTSQLAGDGRSLGGDGLARRDSRVRARSGRRRLNVMRPRQELGRRTITIRSVRISIQLRPRSHRSPMLIARRGEHRHRQRDAVSRSRSVRGGRATPRCCHSRATNPPASTRTAPRSRPCAVRTRSSRR